MPDGFDHRAIADAAASVASRPARPGADLGGHVGDLLGPLPYDLPPSRRIVPAATGCRAIDMNKARATVTDKQPARESPRFDPPALRAAAVLAVCIGAAAAFVLYGLFTRNALWQGLASRGWLAALLVLALALVLLVAFDVTRRKNVSWRLLRARFGQPLAEAPDRRNHGAGRGQLAGHTYWGVRSMGSPGGIEVARVLAPVNRPLYIPWSEVSAIEAYPNVLTGKRGFETDMGARITVRGSEPLTVEVPWLAEFRKLMPKSVRFRLVKLPAQG